MAAKYYDPYKITDKVGQVAYHLQLPEGALIYPVFHVSQLKAANSKHINPSALPPLQIPTSLLKPMAILDKKS